VYSVQFLESNKNYKVKYRGTRDLLAEKRGLSSEVKETADRLANGLKPSHEQHHDARHVAAASLHLACLRHGKPSTVKYFAVKISELQGYEKKGAHVKRVWDSVRTIRDINDIDSRHIVAEEFVPLICDRVHAGEQVEDFSLEIVEEIRDRVLASGKSQIGMAAVAVYLAEKHLDGCDPDIERFSEASVREKATILSNASTVSEELDLQNMSPT